MARATFRFYGELNDFLPPERRRTEFEAPCAQAATTKHMIEALGVPHTEVALILVNGEPAGFGKPMADGDRVSVYPGFTTLDPASSASLQPKPPFVPRFVADAHLGGLARLLRMAGFDTLYDNGFLDPDLVAIARSEDRIVLSRDIELLKRRDVALGCYLHATDPDEQLREVAFRFHLASLARPFSRCLRCNTRLRPVEKADVLDHLPDNVRAGQARFSRCEDCGRIYWEGSHWQAMRDRLAAALGAAGGSERHGLDEGHLVARIQR